MTFEKEKSLGTKFKLQKAWATAMFFTMKVTSI
jgi:hypothetical protein